MVDNSSLSVDAIKILGKDFLDIILLLNKNNLGPSNARNSGLRIAKGKYIQFLDADDWIAPDKLKIQYNKSISLNYPTVISSTWARVNTEATPDNHTILSVFNPSFSNPISFSLIKTDNFMPLMSALILKERILSVGGFDEQMWLLEDINLSIRLSERYDDFFNIDSDKPLFFYRSNNPNSLSESNKKKFNQNNLKNYLLVKDILSNNFIKNDVIKNIWLIYFNAILTKDNETLHRSIKEINCIRPLKFNNNIKLSISSFIGFKTFAFLYPFFAKINHSFFFLWKKHTTKI